MWQKNLELTSEVAGKEFYTREMKKINMYGLHTTKHFKSCPETYRMVEVVYGVTADDEQRYISLLNSVTSLPCIVNLECFGRLMQIDGVLTDVFENGIPAENLTESTPLINFAVSNNISHIVSNNINRFGSEEEEKQFFKESQMMSAVNDHCNFGEDLFQI